MDDFGCPICLDKIEPGVRLLTPCSHSFCTFCLLNTKLKECQWKCPYCKHSLSVLDITAHEGNPIAEITCKSQGIFLYGFGEY